MIKMQAKNLEALKEVEELEKEWVEAKKELSSLLYSVVGNTRIFARIPAINGTKYLHSWSIMDSQVCFDWILKQLN